MFLRSNSLGMAEIVTEMTIGNPSGIKSPRPHRNMLERNACKGIIWYALPTSKRFYCVWTGINVAGCDYEPNMICYTSWIWSEWFSVKLAIVYRFWSNKWGPERGEVGPQSLCVCYPSTKIYVKWGTMCGMDEYADKSFLHVNQIVVSEHILHHFKHFSMDSKWQIMEMYDVFYRQCHVATWNIL